jgi:putative intracellular protease/amidase
MVMRRRWIIWGGAGIAGLLLAMFGAWFYALPPATEGITAAPISAAETRALNDGLKPPKRQRPLIAMVGINDATETTDYVVPYGILRRADVADVMMLATEPGPVKLYPALAVEPQATVADFDARHPDGADYVIVPAMSRDDDAAALEWIRNQAAKGAIIIGICAGAKVVGNAGLLDGKRATTHWFFLEELMRERPAIRYVADRRIVVDGGIVTTTGITASMPFCLTLIEAIAGRTKAETVARELGLADWSVHHDSDAFRLTRPFVATVIRNTLTFWNRERFGLELTPGMDEVTLALVADAWSRTYRSRAVTFASGPGTVETANGLQLIPDHVVTSWAVEHRLPMIGVRRPADALDEALGRIAARYGPGTANVVVMQLEYPRRDDREALHALGARQR